MVVRDGMVVSVVSKGSAYEGLIGPRKQRRGGTESVKSLTEFFCQNGGSQKRFDKV